MSEEEREKLDRELAIREQKDNLKRKFSLGQMVTFKDGKVRKVEQVLDDGEMYKFSGIDYYIGRWELGKFI